MTALASILTTFFDSADNAYLPTIVEREQLVDANGALAASGSASEFLAFGVSGFLVQLLTAPIAIALDAASYLVSALLLTSIRGEEPPPPLPEDREPVLAEIRDGLRLVRHDPVLRAFAGAQMSLAALWGIFGATWFLFVLEELKLGAAALGVIAGVGGVSSFVGAIVATRATRRWGIGPVAIAAMLLSAVGNAFIPLAPAGLPLVAIGCLVIQQLVADSAVTVYDITEVSVRQTLVHDRALGRVASTFHVAGGHRPARGDARGRAPRRGDRAAGDVLAGAARGPPRGRRPVVLAGPPAHRPAGRRRRRPATRPARDRGRFRDGSAARGVGAEPTSGEERRHEGVRGRTG